VSGRVLAVWQADRAAYIRVHVTMAVLGSAAACAALYWLGNADWWVGAVAAPLAIAVRGVYLASEELALCWELTPDAVRASNGKTVALRDIAAVRTIGSAVQLVTEGGDKHLMKYMADPGGVRKRIGMALPGGDR
jgi:hypothetical protein